MFQIFFYFRVNIKESSVAKLGSVCRRVYRIFSHAYYHHQNIYNKFEVIYWINITILSLEIMQLYTNQMCK